MAKKLAKKGTRTVKAKPTARTTKPTQKAAGRGARDSCQRADDNAFAGREKILNGEGQGGNLPRPKERPPNERSPLNIMAIRHRNGHAEVTVLREFTIEDIEHELAAAVRSCRQLEMLGQAHPDIGIRVAAQRALANFAHLVLRWKPRDLRMLQWPFSEMFGVEGSVFMEQWKSQATKREPKDNVHDPVRAALRRFAAQMRIFSATRISEVFKWIRTGNSPKPFCGENIFGWQVATEQRQKMQQLLRDFIIATTGFDASTATVLEALELPYHHLDRFLDEVIAPFADWGEPSFWSVHVQPSLNPNKPYISNHLHKTIKTVLRREFREIFPLSLAPL
jgi:hypothetical protein